MAQIYKAPGQKKAPKGQGTYTYADGYTHWVYGMSGVEKRNNEREHGKIVRYVPGV